MFDVDVVIVVGNVAGDVLAVFAVFLFFLFFLFGGRCVCRGGGRL